MPIPTIKDAEQREAGVYPPSLLQEKIKQILFDENFVNTDDSLGKLVKEFSLFQLHELAQSVVSSLKAYYGRNIINEEATSFPKHENIDQWELQFNRLTLLQLDSQNFSSREQLETIIIELAPLLRNTA